ncbi:hypothetical protein GGR56DRAFT_646156, partial [Xylariaceae sp. FL0804]
MGFAEIWLFLKTTLGALSTVCQTLMLFGPRRLLRVLVLWRCLRRCCRSTEAAPGSGQPNPNAIVTTQPIVRRRTLQSLGQRTLHDLPAHRPDETPNRGWRTSRGRAASGPRGSSRDPRNVRRTGNGFGPSPSAVRCQHKQHEQHE